MSFPATLTGTVQRDEQKLAVLLTTLPGFIVYRLLWYIHCTSLYIDCYGPLRCEREGWPWSVSELTRSAEGRG